MHSRYVYFYLISHKDKNYYYFIFALYSHLPVHLIFKLYLLLIFIN